MLHVHASWKNTKPKSRGNNFSRSYRLICNLHLFFVVWSYERPLHRLCKENCLDIFRFSYFSVPCYQRKQVCKFTRNIVLTCVVLLCISQFPSPPDPRALAFFCLRWQILEGGDSWAVKSPGVGTKKEDKCSVVRQHCNIFHWSHSRIMPF